MKRSLCILLVKPHISILVAKRLQDFLHLEPLELEIVAGGIPDEDSVSICDLSLERKPVKAFIKQLKEKKPDIIGFTGYSSQASIVKELAHIAKTYNPSVVVAVGGIHATIAPSDYSGDDIDLIVRGEGGTAFREIVKRFKEKKPLAFGQAVLSSKAPDFDMKASAPPPKFPDLNDIPRPRRDLVKRSRYFSVWSSSSEKKMATIFPRIATIRTSYGCAFSCSFCVVPHVMGSKYLQRTPEDVVDEIEAIQEDHIYFVDDETFLNPKRMTKIAELLRQRGIKKEYVSWARSDTIVKNPELFRLWREVGLEIVYVGLEAMDDSRLDTYNKKTTVENNQKAILFLQETGITLHASFMIDPGFSVNDFKLLEKKITNIGPAEISFTVFSPSPGTELWSKNKDKYICNPYLFYDCFHSILPTKLELKEFYYYFAQLHRVGGKRNPIRLKRVLIPLREIAKSIFFEKKYFMALKNIYRDYPLI